ncbi:hypothetical protein IVB69_13555 [Flavobacterium sp. J49]|uniref:hypothetical protein n=1 Tax=Flavobacterium sp. J49 TaxID=2718534 RepID=UPI001594992A|nr:hypothetical protein [Flavobacterium sp. J49]MBF6642512.1 hypothetical protein [Flavobacterium sp. J49]NIC03758.1 hypothetical protein [Flavobacterium sp. J49]
MKSKCLLLLLFVNWNCFTQESVNLIKSSHDLYEANYLMDFEAIVKLSYPPMVANIGKEVLLEKTELHYENEAYRLRYQLPTVPLQYGQTKQINGKSFCVITIRIPKRYFFEAKLTSEEAAAKKVELQEVNNTKDVTFEPNRNSFNVKKMTTYVAVWDETTNGEWKFFNFDNAEQLAAFNALFDETVKRALGLNK